MVPVARRMILRDKGRFTITVGGVAFSVMLMLFLFGVYEGAKRGATAYVTQSPAELWICQNNSNNLLRTSSFFSSRFLTEMGELSGVGDVTGIVRVLVTTSLNERSVTLFLFGFDPSSRLGSPRGLIKGSSHIGPGEIILDRAFVNKHDLELADSLEIQGRNFRLAAVTTGTNAIVAQFAFSTLEDAQGLLGMPGIISFCLLATDGTKDPRAVAEEIRGRFPFLAVFNKDQFVRNNLDEMSSGILPVLGTIALLGLVIGVTLITLMLYGSILERRDEYAVLKAIGISQRALVSVVLKQSVSISTMGFLLGSVLAFTSFPLLLRWVPELSLTFTWSHVGVVTVLSFGIGALGSWAPIHKLVAIYPAEVFRA